MATPAPLQPKLKEASRPSCDACRDHDAARVAPGGTPLFLRASSAPMVVQTKSASPDVGRDDPLEREADRAADQFVGGAPRPTPLSPAHAAGCGCPACKARARDGGDGDPASKIAGLRGAGAPLPPELRVEFESHFGRPLDAVRIHVGPTAQALNWTLRANAFAAGPDIAFAAGRYQPETTAGRHLLAHEVAHTVQQGHAPGIVQRQGADAPAEVDQDEAIRIADEVYEALDWTNENSRLLRALEGRGEALRAAIAAQFQSRHDQSLESYLRSQLDGDMLVKAFALLHSTNYHEQHTQVGLALIPIGTRDEELFHVLESMPLAGRQEMERRYNQAFSSIGEGSLVADLKDDLSGWSKEKSIAMLQRDLTPADHLYFNSVAITGTHTDSVVSQIQSEWAKGPASFLAFEADWDQHVKGQENGSGAVWTGMTLYEAMDDELSGEEWELVKAVLDGAARYREGGFAPVGPPTLEQVDLEEEIRLQVARDTLAAATTGGYTGAGTAESQVFTAVSTLRKIWLDRIERAKQAGDTARQARYEAVWRADRAAIDDVVASEMDEDTVEFKRVQVLLLGDLKPADELYLAKLELDNDAAIAQVTKTWASGGMDALLRDSAVARTDPVNGRIVRPVFDPLFVVPVSSGMPFRRIRCLVNSDADDAERGARRLALELDEGDNDSDLQRGYELVTVGGISSELRNAVIASYVASHLANEPGETYTRKFLSFISRRYEDSNATYRFRDLLDPSTDPDELVRRAEGREKASHSGIFDAVLGGVVRDYENVTGEDTAQVVRESLERLRFIAKQAQAHPDELAAMREMSGAADVVALAGLEYREFVRRLDELRALKRAIAEAIATAAELAIEAAITVATGGAAAGALIASLSAAVAGMVLREALLGQDYDLISAENAKRLAITVASHGFAAAGRGAFAEVVNPETLKKLGRAGAFLEGAATEAATQIGTQFTTAALEGKLPTAETLSASAVSIVFSSGGAGAGRAISHGIGEHTPAINRMRTSVASSIAQDLISTSGEEGAALIRGGAGNLTGADIVLRFGSSAAGSIQRGTINGVSSHRAQEVARARQAGAGTQSDPREHSDQDDLDRVMHEKDGAPRPVGTVVISPSAAEHEGPRTVAVAFVSGHTISLVRGADGEHTLTICSNGCARLVDRLREAQRNGVAGLEVLIQQAEALLPSARKNATDIAVARKVQALAEKVNAKLGADPALEASFQGPHQPAPEADPTAKPTTTPSGHPPGGETPGPRPPAERTPAHVVAEFDAAVRQHSQGMEQLGLFDLNRQYYAEFRRLRSATFQVDPSSPLLVELKKKIAAVQASPEYRAATRQFLDVRGKLEVEFRAATGITPEIYEQLRGRTPTSSIRERFRSEIVDPAHSGQFRDPIYGHAFTETPDVDHIVSMKEITLMPGFKNLTLDQQVEVLNLETNFIAMDLHVNRSKGDQSWSTWGGNPEYNQKHGPIKPEVHARFQSLEAQARVALQKAIQERQPKP